MIQFTLVERNGGRKLEVQHSQSGNDVGYDWSCIQVTRTEARWLARKLAKWASERPASATVSRSTEERDG